LGDRALAIEHVGSTSVPGLPAKPIIDIDVSVVDPRAESTYVPGLEAVGFRLRVREPGWHEHRLLVVDDPRVNVHVFGPDSAELVRHRMLRDWLIQHPDDRDRYAAVKRAIAAETVNVRAYSEAKNEIIDDIYRRAFSARG